jgi:NTE family protein
MRIGLVLGAGGVMGGAWLTGGLQALATVTGWDPASADQIVGTSAGSMIGGLLSCGVPPWFMVAHSAGESFDGLDDTRGTPASAASRNGGADFHLHSRRPPLGPGSWKLIGHAAVAPHRMRASAAIAGFLPRGVVSTEPLKDTIRRVAPDGWSPHPSTWIVACDYADGHRVAFGRHDAPPAELADAVAASCAIPGFYHPVTIGGRRYVDGGLWSTSNLDIVRGAGLDLVICLNPTSSLHPPHAWNPAERVAGLVRRGSGRRLGWEARRLRQAGTEVVLIQPTRRDLDVMGVNLMSSRRRQEVIATAIATVGEQLREPAVRELLTGLPAGEPHKVARPAGDPSTWPQVLPVIQEGAA